MVMMQSGKTKRYVADALVDTYKKNGFTVVGESSSDETAASEATATTKKTTAKKAAAKEE